MRLSPKRVLALFRRAWRIYVTPPKESKVFLDYKELPVISTCLSREKTLFEPKQVAVDHARKLAYVSCMKGHSLQEFSFSNDSLILTNEWSFPEQCVECQIWRGLIILTTTNFKWGSGQKSRLWIFDPKEEIVVSFVDTEGEWSKIIAVDDERRVAFVSNWRSNDISVIDLSDLSNLKVIQKVSCDEAPRGMVLLSDGRVVATSFYGKRIFSVAKEGEKYELAKKSALFNPQGYGGNMRDILIGPDGKILFVSNLGRNMVHWYDPKTLELLGSLLIPRKPNSMRVMSDNKTIGVSCRADNLVFFFDSETKKSVGVSAKTGKLPTGLAAIDGGFLVTNFDSSSIELHKINR